MNFLILILIPLYNITIITIFFSAQDTIRNRCFRKSDRIYEIYRAFMYHTLIPIQQTGRIRTKFMMSCRKLAFISQNTHTFHTKESSKCIKNSSSKKSIFFSSTKFPYFFCNNHGDPESEKKEIIKRNLSHSVIRFIIYYFHLSTSTCTRQIMILVSFYFFCDEHRHQNYFHISVISVQQRSL